MVIIMQADHPSTSKEGLRKTMNARVRTAELMLLCYTDVWCKCFHYTFSSVLETVLMSYSPSCIACAIFATSVWIKPTDAFKLSTGPWSSCSKILSLETCANSFTLSWGKPVSKSEKKSNFMRKMLLHGITLHGPFPHCITIFARHATSHVFCSIYKLAILNVHQFCYVTFDFK